MDGAPRRVPEGAGDRGALQDPHGSVRVFEPCGHRHCGRAAALVQGLEEAGLQLRLRSVHEPDDHGMLRRVPARRQHHRTRRHGGHALRP